MVTNNALYFNISFYPKVLHKLHKHSTTKMQPLLGWREATLLATQNTCEGREILVGEGQTLSLMGNAMDLLTGSPFLMSQAKDSYLASCMELPFYAMKG